MGVLVIRSLGMSMFRILGVKLMGMLMLVVVFLFMGRIRDRRKMVDNREPPK
jgi:hypothetical protein